MSNITIVSNNIRVAEHTKTIANTIPLSSPSSGSGSSVPVSSVENNIQNFQCDKSKGVTDYVTM